MHLQHMNALRNVINSVCSVISVYIEYLETQYERNMKDKSNENIPSESSLAHS